MKKIATIKHEDGKWVLYNKAGTKVLGRHDSKDEALQQERAIQISKRKKMSKKGHSADTVELQILDPEGNVKAKIAAEIADTFDLRRKGLSGRPEIQPGTGMFFDKAGAYWMKDVNFDLDILFLDKQGMILEKQHMPMLSKSSDFRQIRY